MKNSLQIIKILGIISLVIILSFLKISIGKTQSTVEIPNPVSHKTFQDLLMAVLTFLQGIGAIVAVFALIAGAFKFMSAQGDPEKVKEGYQMIFWVIIGLFVIISARAFVEFLRRSLGATR